MKSLTIRLTFFKTAVLCLLVSGLVFTACKKDKAVVVPPADFTSLTAALKIAQGLNDSTAEGTKPGYYEAGNKAALITALTTSKAVAADPKATQTSVNNTAAQLLAAVAAYQSHLIKEIAAASLIGFWKMNGNTADSSGNKNDGVATAGHPYYGAGVLAAAADRFGRAGMAYHFDMGSNINVPYKASLNPAQMSISLWVKWSSTGRTVNPNTYTMVAMNRWNGYKFQLQDIHLPFFTVKALKSPADTTIYDRATDNGFPITENTWRHLVVTFKSGQMSFYINGDLVTTWDATSSRPVPGDALTLPNPIDFVIGQDLPTAKYLTVDGDYQVAWGGFFTGDMDDVMFYNIALDGPQVTSIFNNQKTL
ncbi:LamG domain-containing protein [Ferruginibacter sp.]|uniref:LamG domain-containing protein n=1 Tax=Ferruginibacter sp. TaxID=1940288 RepID=UPI00374D1CAD